MAWIKVESSVRTHKKFLRAGPAASWLWLCSVAYCQEGRTDGFIPFEALNYLGVKSPGNLKCKLVAVGLWDEVPGGWQVHDYLDTNRSAAEIRRIQDERREAGKRGGMASGEARRKQVASTDAEANAKQVASHPPEAPVEPININSTATATEAETEAAKGRPSPPRAPLHQPRRLDVVFEGPRVYVPRTVHQKFLRLRNHAGAEAELQAWYLRVSDEWFDGARKHQSPGANMLAFWDARYDEEWPPVKVAATATKARPSWAVER